MKHRTMAIGAALVMLAALYSCSHAPDPVPPPGPTEAQLKEAAPRPLTLSQFVLGPGDELEVRVWRQKDMDTNCLVSPLGTITMPLVGNIQAAGRNLPDVEDQIRTVLAKYYVEPKVTVGVKAVRSMKIYVMGEVNKPGIFAFDEPLTVLQAISMAGGFTNDARRDSVLLARGDLSSPALRKLNLEAALERDNFGDNVPALRGDVIYVPATEVANAERFFLRIANFLKPVIDAERAIILGPIIPTAVTSGSRRIIISP
jgi:polysaccharide export outer membrane protein